VAGISSRAMAVKIVGEGSQYAVATLDADYLDDFKTDRLYFPRSPPNILVKTFWSLIPYDTRTRSVLRTDRNTGSAVRILVSVGSDIPDHVG
jgi:hypothetical protein